jgi:hypothetical protein
MIIGWTRWAAALAFTLLALLGATEMGCRAHELRPAFLSVSEVSPGMFACVFKTPMIGDRNLSLRVAFSGRNEIVGTVSSEPTGDAMVQTWRLRTIDPLAGQILTIDGLSGTMTDALVRVEYLNGGHWTERLTPSRPSLAAPAGQGVLGVATTFIRHGVEHILFGFDHLLFVVSLMLIVRSRLALLKTITAFTLAHSLTLTLSTLNVVSLPTAPVEAAIAMSIVFVAAEIVRRQRGGTSLAIDKPWLVAFAFGLLHGFGFATALATLGLPTGDIPLALLSFNIGVEIGQLLFVAGILIAMVPLRQIFTLPAVAVPAAAYAIGIVAAYWCIARLEVVISLGST